ncbi:MAG: Uncharacterised protein [Flavobacteriia bacterium]|nr:MAG: Uncharacterised protein [Flavobacteriia bacterium]
MNKSEKIQSIIGWVFGLLLPPISLQLILYTHPEYRVIGMLHPESMMRLNFQMLSMGMLANGALFFLALRLDKETLSKGVLHASMLWLLAIILIKFLVFN